MTPIALGTQPSNSPLPAGRPVKHPVTAGGGIAWPASPPNWFNLSGGIAQLGPFNLPYRFWLRAGAVNIFDSDVSWTRYDCAIYLLQGGVGYVNDLNGQQFHQNADSEEAGAGWCGNGLEATFYCEANIPYYARYLTQNAPGGVYYYQHPTHTTFWAYTVGEGVY